VPSQLNILQATSNISNAQQQQTFEASLLFHDEIMLKSGSRIRYFIAEFAQGLNSSNVKIQPQMPDEILQHGYYTVEKAVEMLHPARAKFLQEALDLYKTTKQSQQQQ